MVEITLNTSPGTNDVSIDGVSLNDIDAFRTECLSGGSVSCDWGALHTRLINHDVSNFWWLLTEQERRSIAEMAIKNTMYFNIKQGRSGEPSCAGGIGSYTELMCTQNAHIRYMKFSGELPTDMDACYWKYGTSEHCYMQNETYGLPCNFLICIGPSGTDAHAMCAIQVIDEIDSLDNWVIFQYSTCDIKPGGWHIPYNAEVTMRTPTELLRCGASYYSDIVAVFKT